MAFAAIWIDLEMIILSEVRERQLSYDITCMWNLKNDPTYKWFHYKWTYLQNSNRFTDFEIYVYWRGNVAEGII